MKLLTILLFLRELLMAMGMAASILKRLLVALSIGMVSFQEFKARRRSVLTQICLVLREVSGEVHTVVTPQWDQRCL